MNGPKIGLSRFGGQWGLGLILGSVLVGGCVGEVDRQEPPDTMAPDSGVSTPPVEDPLCIDPGSPSMRMLTGDEYVRTVKGIFGVTIPPAVFTAVLPSEGKVGGFRNNVSVQGISDQLLEGYAALAEYVVERITVNTLVSCALVTGTVKSEACHRTLIESLGTRIYRRPLDPAESTLLFALAQQSERWADPADAVGAAKLIVEAMLQAPQFVFRPELDRPVDSKHRELIPLDDHEMATRLAYAFLGEGPNALLLDAAKRGVLTSADGIETTVAALFKEDAARLARRDFGAQLFHLADVESEGPSANQVGELGDIVNSVKIAAVEEIRLLSEELFSGQGSALEILRAPIAYVNGYLAQVYKIDSVPPNQRNRYTRIDLAGMEGRGGLFATAAFSIHTTTDGVPSPPRRGLYVREVLMCNPPPPPPPSVQTMMDDIPDASRTTLAQCKGCHLLMDPIGWGLSQYDAIGRFKGGTGKAGEFHQSGQIRPFTGASALADIVMGEEQTAKCMVERGFQWLMGREVEAGDQCVIDAAYRRFADSGFKMPEMWYGLVRSDAFRYRRAVTAP